MPEPLAAVCSSLSVCSSHCVFQHAWLRNWLSGRTAFWLPQLLFLLSEVVPPQLCAAATTHPASLQLPCFAVSPAPHQLCCPAPIRLSWIGVTACCARSELALLSVRCERLRSAARLLLSMRCAKSWFLSERRAAADALYNCDGVPSNIVQVDPGATAPSTIQSITAPAGRPSERANTTQEHIDEAAI